MKKINRIVRFKIRSKIEDNRSKIEDKKIRKGCRHNKLIEVGHWDGIGGKGGIGGIVAKCKLCGKEFDFTDEEWEKIPKERKIEIRYEIPKEGTPEYKEYLEKIRKGEEKLEKSEIGKRMRKLFKIPSTKPLSTVLDLDYKEFMKKMKRVWENEERIINKEIRVARTGKSKKKLMELKKKVQETLEKIKSSLHQI